MAVVQATVKVLVQMEGAGNLTDKAKAGEAAVDKLKAQVGAAGAAAGSAKKQTDSLVASITGLKDSVKPVDQVRGTFENLRSNLLGFPAVIGSMVVGIASLAEKFLEAGSAAERLREKQPDYQNAKQELERVREGLRNYLGRGPDEGPLKGLVGADVGDKIDELNDSLLALGERKRELEGLNSIFAQLPNQITDLIGGLDSADRRYLAIAKINNEILETEQILKDVRNDSADALARQHRILTSIVTGGLRGAARGAGSGNVIDLDAHGGPTVIGPPGGRGGGGGGRRRDVAGDLISGLARGSESSDRAYLEQEREADARALASRLSGYDDTPSAFDVNGIYSAANDNGTDSGRGFSSSGGRAKGPLGAIVGAKLAARDLAKDINTFTEALANALPTMGSFNTALMQIGEIWSKWGENGKKTGVAIANSIGAIAEAGAQEIKDERLRAGVLSIIELGLGFANIENPPVAAAHFTAAATLGSVAIFGGGGSAGGRGGRGSGSSGASRAGRLQGESLGQRAVQVVVNGNYYAFGRGDQEAATDLTRMQRRANGTGFESAA